MDNLHVAYNTDVCLKSKFTEKCVGVETQTQILRANYLPSYVEQNNQLQKQRVQQPFYTLKLKVINRDQDKSDFILQGSKVHLINILTDEYVICSISGQIKFDKKSGISEEINKNLYKASTFTVQFFKSQGKLVQSGKQFITVYDQLCLKSVHSTYLTLRNNLQLYASSEVDAQKSVFSFISASVPFIPQWVFSRSSFNKFSKSPSPSQFMPLKDKKPLDSFPPQVQQAYLVQDLLDIMLGFDGIFIKKRKERNQFVIQQQFQQPTCGMAVTQLVYKILALPTLYNKVEMYIATFSIQGGVVCQALCGGLRKLVKQYKMMVVQFDQIAKQGLSLQKLWYLAQASLKVMQSLGNLVDHCQNYRGGQLITCITRLLNQTTDHQIIQIYNYLFSSIMQVYCQTLSKWLYQGIIQDRYQQFMILTSCSNNKQWLEWEQKFLIRQNQIPSILLKDANKILTTGKYLNILKSCNRMTQYTEEKDVINNFMKYVELQSFTQPIARAYEWANQKMLQLVFEQYKFNDVLKSVKGYYFLQFGDLFVHFMDAAQDDLFMNKKRTQNSKNKQFHQEKVKNLFQLLLRTSSANNDPFKQDVSIRLDGASLYEQIHRIKTLQPTKLNFDFAQKSYIKNQAKYMDYLTIDYKCKFPLTLIFNKKNMSKYQVLFRFLFWCKFMQRQLNGLWLCLQGTKQISSPFYIPAYLLNQRMINFIKNFIYYLCYEVIQVNWEILQQNLKKVKAFQDIIECHNTFLNDCLTSSILANSKLLQIITADVGKSLQSFLTLRNLITELVKEFNFQSQKQPSSKGRSLTTQRKQFMARMKASISKSLLQQDFKVIVKGYGDCFDDSMKRLLREIYNMVGKEDNHLLNLLNRIDEEKYYNKRLFGPTGYTLLNNK